MIDWRLLKYQVANISCILVRTHVYTNLSRCVLDKHVRSYAVKFVSARSSLRAYISRNTFNYTFSFAFDKCTHILNIFLLNDWVYCNYYLHNLLNIEHSDHHRTCLLLLMYTVQIAWLLQRHILISVSSHQAQDLHLLQNILLSDFVLLFQIFSCLAQYFLYSHWMVHWLKNKYVLWKNTLKTIFSLTNWVIYNAKMFHSIYKMILALIDSVCLKNVFSSCCSVR